MTTTMTARDKLLRSLLVIVYFQARKIDMIDDVSLGKKGIMMVS